MMFGVANWIARLNGEDGPRGMPSHEALPVLPQGALEKSSVIEQPPSLVRDYFSSPRVVAKSYKHDLGCRPSTPNTTVSKSLLTKVWGANFEQFSTKGLWSDR